LFEDKKYGDIGDFDPQQILDWKFLIFIHKRYMNNASMASLLE
jgi:hypothetical protein